MPIKAIPALVWKAILGLIARNGMEISGYIAFTGMLALFPFLIFLVSTAGFLGETEIGHQFIDTLSLFAPPDVVKTLQPALQQVIENRNGGLLTFGLAMALYSASSGVSALRLALNLTYGVDETRSFWISKAQDFLIVIVVSVAIILSSVAIILGPFVWHIVTWFFFIDPTDQQIWHIARYIVSLTILAASVVALHKVLPDTPLTFRQILPGAVTTTIAWIAAASILTFYLQSFADYASTYGSLGGVIITLLFFYVSGIIFIFGGELNAALLRHGKGPERPQKELRPSPVPN